MRFKVTRTSGNPIPTDGCMAQEGIFRHRTQPSTVQEMAWYVRDFDNLEDLLTWADGLAGDSEVGYGVILSQDGQNQHWDPVQGDEPPERTIEIWDDHH